MSERKNLEQLFQEKLEHFEVAPPAELWSNIEMELKKKKKRRVVPFWWKLSGVAALLAIGFSLLTTFSGNESGNPINSTTDSNGVNSVVTNENSSGNPKKNNSANAAETGITDPKANTSDEVATASSSEEKSVNNNTNPNNNDSNTGIATVNSSAEKSAQKTKRTAVASAGFGNQQNAVVSHSNINKKQKTKTQQSSKIVNTNEAVVNATHYKSDKNTKESIGTPSGNQSDPQNNQLLLTNKNNGQDDKIAMKNHTDVVQPKGDPNTTDSTPPVNVEPNAMEELLKEKEKQIAQKQKINRWQVTPNLAPVYFGSFAEGSPLDEMLAENNKTYNPGMSYGVGVNYAVNKKLKVRTALNMLSVDYDTHGIVFYQDTNAKTMQNVSPTQQGSMIQIKPLNSVEMQLDRIVNERFDGTLNQKMGYIEMPVELSYTLLDKKFGIELVGGFSTLFLNTNEIFLRTDGLNMKIGKATNLNDIHFSSNLGIGLNYKLLKNFDARIEPTFKYQMNTFSSDSGQFKPYIFGVYSGISYRF